MHLLIDMQGAQTSLSAKRGVGRYTRGLTRAILENRGSAEVSLLFNAQYADEFQTLRHEYSRYVPHESIQAWCSPPVVLPGAPYRSWHAEAAKVLQAGVVNRIAPDAFHVSSLFEGLLEDAVTNVDEGRQTGTMLFDLTPMAREKSLLSDPLTRSWYFDKLASLKKAQCWFTMSEAARSDAIVLLGLDPKRVIVIGAGVDEVFRAPNLGEDEEAAIRAQHSLHAQFVLYYGGFEEHKNVSGLMEGFARSLATRQSSLDLVLVGDCHGETRQGLVGTWERLGLPRGRLRLLGHLADTQLVGLLRCCTVFVYPSFREGFGLPVAEAMAAGAPTICSGTSSLPEVVGDPSALFDPSSPKSISERIDAVLLTGGARERLIAKGRARAELFTWKSAASRLLSSYEQIHASRTVSYIAKPRSLLRRLAHVIPSDVDGEDLARYAIAAVSNTPASGPRRLLVDVTGQVSGHPGSGIARVVDRIMAEMKKTPSFGAEVVPIRYDWRSDAFRVSDSYLGEPGLRAERNTDPIVELRQGDHFLALDLNHNLPRQKVFFERLKQIGGRLSAVVYDLLPLQRPDWFPPGLASAHSQWLEQLATFDALVCISNTVAADLKAELSRRAEGAPAPLIGHFHLGSDLPCRPAGDVPDELVSHPGILLVSIFYPRKGHEQALDAFEHLWATGAQTKLIFAGRVGWGCDTVISRITKHPLYGRKLFWFDGPDDALLGRLYETSAGVLVASEGEGFGLPLVEALLHGRPVLARDLPVFWEIAGDAATYFKGKRASDLSRALQAWIPSLGEQSLAKKAAFEPLSWAESCGQMLRALRLTA